MDHGIVETEEAITIASDGDTSHYRMASGNTTPICDTLTQRIARRPLDMGPPCPPISWGNCYWPARD
jgi:hypothetical protein